MIYGLPSPGKLENSVDLCLGEKSPKEFLKCLEQKPSSMQFEEIYLRHELGKFIKLYESYQTIVVEDGEIGPNNWTVSMTFNNTDDHLLKLFDKNFFFPTRNEQSVPRTVFRIDKQLTHFSITFQVGHTSSI